MDTQQSTFTGWAIVEVFGHQRYAGYVTTEAFGQAVLFRVDVPPLAERESTTQYWTRDNTGKEMPPGSRVKRLRVQGYTKYFGPGAIYALTPCTEDVATAAVDEMQPRTVQLVALPPAGVLAAGPDEDDENSDDDWDDGEDDDAITDDELANDADDPPQSDADALLRDRDV
jgi:hypothetical protein